MNMGRLALLIGGAAALVGVVTMGTDAAELVALGLGSLGAACAIPAVRRWVSSAAADDDDLAVLPQVEARLLLMEEALEHAQLDNARLREESEFYRQLARQ